MFKSVQDVIEQLGDQDYICDKKIATVVFLAQQLGKPVLVEGPAGVGKTELAKVVAKALGRPMIRLQCYEGLDEAKALYEWEYSKQLLYTQILKDKVAETLAGTQTLAEAAERVGAQDSVFFSSRFIVPRPLMQAITSGSAFRSTSALVRSCCSSSIGRTIRTSGIAVARSRSCTWSSICTRSSRGRMRISDGGHSRSRTLVPRTPSSARDWISSATSTGPRSERPTSRRQRSRRASRPSFS